MLGDVGKLVADVEQLCRELAPHEFEWAHPYVIAAGDLPEHESEMLRLCMGYTSAVLDLRMRDYLAHRGRWLGRGFCTIVLECFHKSPAQFFGTVLHELAHWLNEPGYMIVNVDDLPSDMKWVERARQRAAGKLAEKPPADDAECHHSDFYRACVHLAHRAHRAGSNATLEAFNIGHRRGGVFYRPVTYAAALGSEPCERQADSLRSILSSPAPPTWQALWASIDRSREQMNEHAGSTSAVPASST